MALRYAFACSERISSSSRDTSGRLGALDEHCRDRRRIRFRTGRNEETVLRCLYHGWKLDVEGNVVEMAFGAVASGLCEGEAPRVSVQEAGGFVWHGWAIATTLRRSSVRLCRRPTNQSQRRQVVVRAIGADPRRRDRFGANSSTLHSSDMRPARVAGAKATDKSWLRRRRTGPEATREPTPFAFATARFAGDLQRRNISVRSDDAVRGTGNVC